MITPKDIDALHTALRALDDCHRSIEDLRDKLGKPIAPRYNTDSAEWQDYVSATNRYYGELQGLESAAFVLDRYRRLMAMEWDHRHVHAPAQLATSELHKRAQ